MQNAIVYQAYGLDHVNECRYALLKLLQVYNLTPPADIALVIYTDTPEVFSDFEPFFHNIITLNLARPSIETKSESNLSFAHPEKVEILISSFQRFGGNVLHFDTDTYLTSSADVLFEDMAKGAYYLYRGEGQINKSDKLAWHKWERFLSTTPITFNGKKLLFDKNLKMFNASVIGINNQSKETLQDVLALTNALQERFPRHEAEQFAFNYCFQKSGSVKTADHFIAHYRDLKEFRQLLKTFFAVNTEESIPNLVKKLHHLDAMAIQQEKNAFEKLPLLHRFFRKFTGKSWKIARYEKWL